MSSEFTNHSEIPDDLKHVEQTLLRDPQPPVDRDGVFLAGAASAQRVEAAKPSGVWTARGDVALSNTSLTFNRTGRADECSAASGRRCPPRHGDESSGLDSDVPSPDLPAAATDTAASRIARFGRRPFAVPLDTISPRDVALRMG
jgi:hypothetical protein